VTYKKELLKTNPDQFVLKRILKKKPYAALCGNLLILPI
jgi:hypothetical protein